MDFLRWLRILEFWINENHDMLQSATSFNFFDKRARLWYILSMDKDAQEFLDGTHRQALYLWVGLSLSLTLFFVQSQMFFVKASPLPSSHLEWYFIGLGIITFVFGILFFQNYLRLRLQQLKRSPFNQRKQTILVAYVIQFVLFETLGLYGVLISVLTQNTWKAVPFIVFGYLGFGLSFPRKKKIEGFFKAQISSV